jgi:hypothetical protein
MKRIIKRVLIDSLFVALNAADFRYREYPRHSTHLIMNLSIMGLYALFCFALLLRFVDRKQPWWYVIDAIVLTVLTIVVCDIISVKMHPYDHLSTLIQLSIPGTPILVLVNLTALALAITIMRLGGRVRERRRGAAEAGTGD